MKYDKFSELYHFGIKGQKWGIRRYENADGTLTEAGKKRYGVENIKTKEEIDKMSGHEKRKAFRKERQGLTRRENDRFSLLEKAILNQEHNSNTGKDYYTNRTKRIAKRRADKQLVEKYGNKTIRQVKAENAAVITLGTAAAAAAILATSAIKLKKMNG